LSRFAEVAADLANSRSSSAVLRGSARNASLSPYRGRSPEGEGLPAVHPIAKRISIARERIELRVKLDAIEPQS
jgi:hypothetical protein